MGFIISETWIPVLPCYFLLVALVKEGSPSEHQLPLISHRGNCFVPSDSSLVSQHIDCVQSPSWAWLTLDTQGMVVPASELSVTP